MICPKCQRHFEPKRKEQVYCSQDCARQVMREQKVGWYAN